MITFINNKNNFSVYDLPWYKNNRIAYYTIIFAGTNEQKNVTNIAYSFSDFSGETLELDVDTSNVVNINNILTRAIYGNIISKEKKAMNNQLRAFEFDIEHFDIQDEVIVDRFLYNRIIQINWLQFVNNI